jgi:hypothetical protein
VKFFGKSTGNLWERPSLSCPIYAKQATIILKLQNCEV